MGILDPVPSTVPSPMTEVEGAWVRANAWTKGLRKIEDAYPHGFHRWCSCERGICHPCGSGHHDQCVSAGGPRVDKDAGTMTDRGGFVVAVIQYGPGERPCRWICPCTHQADDEQSSARRRLRGAPGRPARIALLEGRARPGRAALLLHRRWPAPGAGGRGGAVSAEPAVSGRTSRSTSPPAPVPQAARPRADGPLTVAGRLPPPFSATRSSPTPFPSWSPHVRIPRRWSDRWS
ncbi:DUF6248 family natural product biosynthesis protein [Streptomyces sp. NPDC086549]|uniref:DUF6248 family natural product biosynthesis protein n=1 Tax=Streptomyces sp. NPDC086549 TaxID=3365752 RepID=UPI00381AB64B